MGSALSKSPGRIARKAQESSRLPKQGIETVRYEAIKLPDEHTSIQAGRRQTSEEWAEMLKRVSGVISSTTWDDAVEGGEVPMDVKAGGSYRHAAQRSQRVNEKLPSHPPHESNREKQSTISDNLTKRAGRLGHEDIIELFHLRRNEPKVWDAPQLAQRFNVAENDIRQLLVFSRTYLPRSDPDGVVRGYYNPQPDNTIVRFEAD